MASYNAGESSDISLADAAVSSSGDADEYNMRHTNRGYAVIINNKTFRKSKERTGTDVDARVMKNLLLTLGFRENNIRVEHNATESDMFRIMVEDAGKNYTDCDCFVCVILSHGDEDVVVTQDEKTVRIGQLAAKIRREKCPSLARKPKIFIIQACNGMGLDLGVTLSQSEQSTPEEADNVQDEISREEPKKSEPDFLIAHSSVPGYYSWRNENTGSIFIQSLVNVISNNWRQQDLLSMLTEVNKRVAYSTDFKMNSLKQMPYFQTLLTKKLFFHAH